MFGVDGAQEPLISILCKLGDSRITSFNVVHPLEQEWVLWFDYPPTGGFNAAPKDDYLSQLKMVRVGVLSVESYDMPR